MKHSLDYCTIFGTVVPKWKLNLYLLHTGLWTSTHNRCKISRVYLLTEISTCIKSLLLPYSGPWQVHKKITITTVILKFLDVTVWNLSFESCPQSACNRHNRTQTLHAHKNPFIINWENYSCIGTVYKRYGTNIQLLLSTNMGCLVTQLLKNNTYCLSVFSGSHYCWCTHSKQPGQDRKQL